MEVGEGRSCILMITMILIVSSCTKPSSSTNKKMGRCNPKPRLRRLLVEGWELGSVSRIIKASHPIGC